MQILHFVYVTTSD